MKYLLVFIAGFLLMLSFSFFLDWSIEEEVLTMLAKKVENSTEKNDFEGKVAKTLNLSYSLIKPTTTILGSENFTSLKIQLISSSFQSFYYGTGACGTSTLFVARLFKKMGIKTKIVEQNVGGVYGAHITLGIEKDNRLILIDPLFNCLFKDSTGKLSDIHQVAGNWNYYAKNLPPDYDTSYNYQGGWRYTNWDKLGFITRAIYKTGCFFAGKEKMDQISLRYYILGFSFYYGMFSIIGALFFIYLAFRKNIKAYWVRLTSKNKVNTATAID